MSDLPACPDCGEPANFKMRACPARDIATGYHHLPDRNRWLGRAPIVSPAMLFEVLDGCYLRMSVARAMRTTQASEPVRAERWTAAKQWHLDRYMEPMARLEAMEAS